MLYFEYFTLTFLIYLIISICIIFFLHFIYKFIYDSVFIEEIPIHPQPQTPPHLNTGNKGNTGPADTVVMKDVLKKNLKDYMKGLTKQRKTNMNQQTQHTKNTTMINNLGNNENNGVNVNGINESLNIQGQLLLQDNNFNDNDNGNGMYKEPQALEQINGNYSSF